MIHENELNVYTSLHNGRLASRVMDACLKATPVTLTTDKDLQTWQIRSVFHETSQPCTPSQSQALSHTVPKYFSLVVVAVLTS